MDRRKLESIVNYIVEEGERVKYKYLEEETGPVDYLGIFCRDEKEKRELLSLMKAEGEFVQETSRGPHYKLKKPIETKSGPVGLIKIRNTDPVKKHRGAPDFRVDNYDSFKKKYLGRKDFNLIVRPNYEMIEIWDPQADVLVYFLSIPITEQLGPS